MRRPLIRRRWLYHVVRQAQVGAGRILDGQGTSEVLAGFQQAIKSPRTELERLVMKGVAAELADEYVRCSPRVLATGHAHESKARLTAHLLASEYARSWSVAQLAKQIGCNRTVLEAVFKQVHGVGIHRFLIAERIAHAKQNLVSTDDKLDRVAESVGFGSRVTLNRQFIRIVGMTPSEFRRRSRNS